MPKVGGVRIGQGPKPQYTVSDRTDIKMRQPPSDLPDEQRPVWTRYAVKAIDQGTLTPETEGAFRLLCELEVEKDLTREIMNKDGRTYVKVFVDSSGNEHEELKCHPLASHYRAVAKHIESLMGRFKLAPFGKPETSVVQRAAERNPFAKLA